MTAEVAIINRQGIALAADSAVTVGRAKVWKTAHKLFSLGPRHDMAIMVYGTGSYLEFPWDAVVKAFRQENNDKRFDTVRECMEAFRQYLLRDTFKHEPGHKRSVISVLIEHVDSIRREAKVDGDPKVWNADKANEIIDGVQKELAQAIVLFDDLTFEDFKADVGAEIEAYLAETVPEDAKAEFIPKLLALAFDAFRRKRESQRSTGVVFAGFGVEEFFPHLLHFTLDGRLGARLRWWEEEGDARNLNTPDDYGKPCIIPFAQRDMPFLFLTGIGGEHLQFLNSGLESVMDGVFGDVIEKFVPQDQQEDALSAVATGSALAASEFMQQFTNFVAQSVMSPIYRAVSALPKEEMAAMAEALVELTSLRRKIDSRLESVGGPVDVAVISKGDGLVWIKRKHYFKIDINPDFMKRRTLLNGGPDE
ncbi:MAG: hypothetical protein Q8R82_00035 [Hyphomonadaceae bacterium]|nr:hypothetical protein [Hyphomonadaceae bacterium]